MAILPFLLKSQVSRSYGCVNKPLVLKKKKAGTCLFEQTLNLFFWRLLLFRCGLYDVARSVGVCRKSFKIVVKLLLIKLGLVGFENF